MMQIHNIVYFLKIALLQIRKFLILSLTNFRYPFFYTFILVICILLLIYKLIHKSVEFFLFVSLKNLLISIFYKIFIM